MTYKSKAIANYFIDRAREEGRSLTPLQLIKLVYIAHGWHLAITGDPLIEERVHAWKYGPVIEDLYHAFKEFGGRPVERKAQEVRPLNNSFHAEVPELDKTHPSYNKVIEILERVWKSYSHYSAGSLVELTHAEGTPWSEAYNERGPNAVIHDDDIRKCFIEKAHARHARNH